MCDGTSWKESQLRNYDIPLKSVPKFSFDDPRVEQLISENKPVIITGSNLVYSASKWNLEYLEKHMENSTCTVITSPNHNFKYFDEKAITPAMKNKFVPPTKKVSMKISDFSKKLKNWTNGEDRLYLQQTLNNTVGPGIVQDFIRFRWDWITAIQKKMSWGPLTSNLLLIGMEGNVTPCHYDEQQNFFAQVKGWKRIILFSPEHYECLYPHTVFHPHDRQSQVDFEKPDLKRFPRFEEVQGEEAIVGPGEVLYIPVYWWHHVESILNGGYTVSINFWYKAGPTGDIIYPLQGHQKLAIMRNVEKMLNEALKDPEEVGSLLRAIVLGRYTEET
ncbi:hypoxia-inducible factor 1-alpha inhibitor [Halyomorpha halys]|uniref:hypoxia-inducible factor 1-alpha inhibitor n=1 Tax=Halyomorpha halys TaxID=286706 RepID=UPI0006D4F9EB|nr:hypoxia-inducible factor 1-alpha inhibitor-like [Halyomorpha halys]